MKSRMTPALITAAMAAGLTANALACSETATLPTDTDPDAAVAPAPPVSSATDASVDAADVSDATAVYDGAPAPVVCDASPCVVRLVAGQLHYCGLLDDGTVRCWGDPTLLGPSIDGGGTDPGASPVKVDGVSSAVDIAASSTRTCAVLADGGVECWGMDDPAPTPLAEAPPTKRLALGSEMSCAVATSGELDCWGDSAVLGSGARRIDLGERAAADVVVGVNAAFALDDQGELLSWGKSSLVLGRMTSFDVDDVPRPVVGLPLARGIATASTHACAVTNDGHLFCWGAAGDAMLGLGYSRDERYPVAVAFPAGIWPYQVSVSDSHACVRMTDGTVDCWGGLNPWGELGYLKQTPAYVPTKVTTLPPDVVAVTVGLASSCALTKAGVVWCWGDNRSGQLGQGKRDDLRHPSPTPVVFQ